MWDNLTPEKELKIGTEKEVGCMRVSFDKYIENKQELQPLTNIFCDNIMLFMLIPEEQCKCRGGKMFQLKKEITSSINCKVRSALNMAKLELGKSGVKVKHTLLLESDLDGIDGLQRDKDKQKDNKYDEYEDKVAKYLQTIRGSVQDVLKSNNNIREAYNKRYQINIDARQKILISTIKVDLADVKIEDVVNGLPRVLESLHAENTYLLDFDVTKDYANIFDKTETIKHLLNKGFRMEGQYGYDENMPVILRNDATVGRDCLSWLVLPENTNNTIGTLQRCKIYNKFVCQMTSPGVTKTIGNHIHDFLDCPDERLRETFNHPEAKKKGLTRLEITIYGGLIPTIEEITAVIGGMEKKLKGYGLFYSVPFSMQWHALTKDITHTCILYNPEDNRISVAYWASTLTHKITGISYQIPEGGLSKLKHLKHYFISCFSFVNLPVYFIEAVKGKTLEFEKMVYVKRKGGTIATKSNSPFTSNKKVIDVEEKGLVYSPNFIFKTHLKHQNVKSKKPFHIDILEEDPFNRVVSILSEKDRLEAIIEERFLATSNNFIAEKQEERKILLGKFNHELERQQSILAKQKERLDIEDSIVELINRKPCNINEKYKDRGSFEFTVIAFTIEDRTGKEGESSWQHVMYLDDCGDTYFADGFTKQKLLAEAIKGKYNCFTRLTKREKERQYYYSYSNKDLHYIAQFTVSGTFMFNGTECPDIKNQIVEIPEGKRESRPQTPLLPVNPLKIKLQHILKPPTVSSCNKLQDLDKNTDYPIKAIATATFRSVKRYIFVIDKLDGFYVSNSWFDKEIKSKKDLLTNDVVFNMKTFELRKGPNKHIEMCVTLY